MPRLAAAVLALLVLLPSCRSGREAARRPPLLQPGEADDAARFLAGLPGRGTSPFKMLEAGPAWHEHSRRLDAMFADFLDRRAPRIREFAREELGRREDLACPVFYPFAGADALTMLSFFPGRRVYVMAALEPPGRMPRAADFDSGALSSRLPPLASTLESLLRRSFFVTREMDRQLRGQVTDGVAGPLLIQLARLGYTITGFHYITLDARGRPVPRHEDVRRAEFGHNRGLRLEVMRPESSRPATLYYFSVNLDDSHLGRNPAFRRFVESLDRPCTMLKATSYMLHDRNFQNIRALILACSEMILQDDTGIPWRYLDTRDWKVQLYGDYNKPYGRSFEFRLQPGLRAAFELAQPDGAESQLVPAGLFKPGNEITAALAGKPVADDLDDAAHRDGGEDQHDHEEVVGLDLLVTAGDVVLCHGGLLHSVRRGPARAPGCVPRRRGRRAPSSPRSRP